MQWGFRKSVHQNGKLVESTLKYLSNPYLLDESAEHRTHHPESEHYSDEQHAQNLHKAFKDARSCLLYTSPSPRDLSTSRMPSSA